MTAEHVNVLLDGHVAATITRERGRLELTYTEAHVDRRAHTPLSVSMPVGPAPYGHAVVAPWLDGLLPDDVDVRRRWADRYGVSASSPFALLGTPVGQDCAGAARFVNDDETEHFLANEGSVQWLTDDEVGARLRELGRDSAAWLGEDFTGRFSLAGAQSKTALIFDPETHRWGLPQGAASTSHILKPAIAGFDEHDLNEHLCLRAAAACGLLTAPSSIVRFGDTSAVVVTRYDRAPGEPWPTRVHQEDACQALGLPPDLKYQNDGGPGTRDLARLLRAVLSAGDAEAGVWRLFDAATFNWLIGGTDGHAKNFSLLLSGGQVALAPLYDIASALPYGQHPRALRLAMKYGGDYRLQGRTSSVWTKLAQEFSLPPEALRERAHGLMESVADGFAEAAATPEVRALESRFPAALTDAVATRIRSDCRLAFD